MQQHILSGTVPKLDHVLQTSNQNMVTIGATIVVAHLSLAARCMADTHCQATGHTTLNAVHVATVQDMSKQDLFWDPACYATLCNQFNSPFLAAHSSARPQYAHC